MSDAKIARCARFLNVFLVIRDELVEHIKQQGLPESAAEWYRRVSRSITSCAPEFILTCLQNFDYYATRGKLNRGMAVIDTVEILKGRSITRTDDEYFKAAVLGWCVELVRFPLYLLYEGHSLISARLSVSCLLFQYFDPAPISRQRFALARGSHLPDCQGPFQGAAVLH